MSSILDATRAARASGPAGQAAAADVRVIAVLGLSSPVLPVPIIKPRTTRQRVWLWACRIHPMPTSLDTAAAEFHWLDRDSIRRALHDLKLAGKIRFVDGSKRLYECVPDAAPPGVQGRKRVTFLPV